jgi:hypothetical protein
MFGLSIKLEDRTTRVKDAAEKGSYRSFSHAAASLRKRMAASIERSQEPSDVGDPPHTRRGQLKRSFRFAADKEGAVIGPLHSRVGESAAAHEFGGDFKGDTFEERPFAFPALEALAPRLAEEWRGQIGE